MEVFEGKRENIDEKRFDYIFKSPGIVMDEENPKYTSQTQIFMEEYGAQTIGITGTKGKSTTSSLLYTVLNACSGRETLLMGNIGLPCLDYFDHISEDTIIVYELSCHQLAHLTISPHIAVFLNLFEDHLDYYRTMDRYFTAKTHISTSQKEDDFLYIGDNVPQFETKAVKTVITSGVNYEYELSIEGDHNRYNAEIVYRIATERFGCEPDSVRKALKSFKGLAHRLEYFATSDGVEYYDDSISTIPQATISAATSLKHAKTLLIGGMDRGIDYGILEDFIDKNDQYNYVLMYETGKRILSELSEKDKAEPVGREVKTGDRNNVFLVEDLEKAVELAKKITHSGEACILSPAAASYGYFKNFEERGDVFKQLVGE